MNTLDARARKVAITLSALAGFVDALGFLELGGFFVSFMSGNTTRLGVGVAGAMPEAWIAGGLMLTFMLGVTGGGGHWAQGRRASADRGAQPNERRPGRRRASGVDPLAFGIRPVSRFRHGGHERGF
jgi:hypothetical protein